MSLASNFRSRCALVFVALALAAPPAHAELVTHTFTGQLTTITNGSGVTADLTGRVKAGELVNHVAQQVGGKGGGRADMAQAGGTDAAKLPDALASVKDWVAQRV